MPDLGLELPEVGLQLRVGVVLEDEVRVLEGLVHGVPLVVADDQAFLRHEDRAMEERSMMMMYSKGGAHIGNGVKAHWPFFQCYVKI